MFTNKPMLSLSHTNANTQVLAGIPDLSKTLVLVASKSGGTLETLTNEKMVRKYFEDKGLDPKQHFAW